MAGCLSLLLQFPVHYIYLCIVLLRSVFAWFELALIASLPLFIVSFIRTTLLIHLLPLFFFI
jgi:hypothetical protein